MTSAHAVYPSLAGRAVFVTGGGSGIGAAIVAAFARQKSKVAFVDIDEKASAAVQAGLGDTPGHFERCDVRDVAALRQAIQNARERLGPITVLVNNAARDDRHASEEVTPEYWDERIAVNLKHQFFASQAVAPMMKEAGGGSIINMGSTSWMIGLGGMVAYTASKSAVTGLTRSLARDLGPFNIRVNTLLPGWIMTERQTTLWLTPEGEKTLMQSQCLKRKLYPEDIAKVALFLASDESGACTNQDFIADGGWI